jgi:hypothetical protein
VAAVLPAALGLAVAVQLLNGAPASGFQTDPGAVAEVCTDDSAPEVCVLKVHEHDLSTVVGPARQALTLLAKLPDAPTSVHEVAADRAGPQPVAQVWLSSENHQPKGGWLGDGQDGLLMRLLAGAGTLPCNDDDQYSYRTRSLVAGWFSGEEPARTPAMPTGTPRPPGSAHVADAGAGHHDSRGRRVLARRRRAARLLGSRLPFLVPHVLSHAARRVPLTLLGCPGFQGTPTGSGQQDCL